MMKNLIYLSALCLFYSCNDNGTTVAESEDTTAQGVTDSAGAATSITAGKLNENGMIAQYPHVAVPYQLDIDEHRGEDKSNVFSFFKVEDVRTLANNASGSDLIQLLTAANSENDPMLIFRITSGTKITYQLPATDDGSTAFGLCPLPKDCRPASIAMSKKKMSVKQIGYLNSYRMPTLPLHNGYLASQEHNKSNIWATFNPTEFKNFVDEATDGDFVQAVTGADGADPTILLRRMRSGEPDVFLFAVKQGHCPTETSDCSGASLRATKDKKKE